MMQNEKMQELKKNPEQQKMLNEVLNVTNDAIKKEFPVFLKLVQADVSNVIFKNVGDQKCTIEQINTLTKTMNEMMSQVGKDLEKQMMKKFAALKEESVK